MNFEDIVNFIKTILLILSLPITYMQLRKTSYDKAQNLIEEMSKIILYRMYSNHLISKEEIKAIIKSKSLNSKISNSLIKIDDVLDRITDKIEDIPFFSKKDRRRILESIRLLREGNYSLKLKVSQFIKNFEKQIITTSFGFIIAFLLLFPSQFRVTNSTFVKQYFLLNIAIGIFIIIAMVIIFFIFNRMIYPKIDWGTVKIKITTFQLLPNFYDEAIMFYSEINKMKFKLIETSFEEEKKIVETNPGFPFFGMVRYYKKFQSYRLKISNTEKSIDIQIELKTKSFVNGGIDVDFIVYSIFEKNEIKAKFELPILTNTTIGDSSLLRTLNDNLTKLISSENKSTLILSDRGQLIYLDKKFRLIGIDFGGEIFQMKNRNFEH